jgi:hypothetical protein
MVDSIINGGRIVKNAQDLSRKSQATFRLLTLANVVRDLGLADYPALL